MEGIVLQKLDRRQSAIRRFSIEKAEIADGAKVVELRRRDPASKKLVPSGFHAVLLPDGRLISKFLRRCESPPEGLEIPEGGGLYEVVRCDEKTGALNPTGVRVIRSADGRLSPPPPVVKNAPTVPPRRVLTPLSPEKAAKLAAEGNFRPDVPEGYRMVNSNQPLGPGEIEIPPECFEERRLCADLADGPDGKILVASEQKKAAYRAVRAAALEEARKNSPEEKMKALEARLAALEKKP